MKVFILAPVFSPADNNVDMLQQKQSILWKKNIENYSSNGIITIDPEQKNDFTKKVVKIILSNNIDCIMTVNGWEQHDECITIVQIARLLGLTVTPETVLLK